jgi:hypothetical protein
MSTLIRDDKVWQKLGADNFEDFAKIVHELPAFLLQSLIEGKYDFAVCKKIYQAIYGKSSLDVMDALKMLLPEEKTHLNFDNPYQIFAIVIPEYENAIKKLTYQAMNRTMIRYAAIGFLERLISPQQMANLDSSAICFLFQRHGITALKNNLITPEYAATINPPYKLNNILNELVMNFDPDFDWRKDTVVPPSKRL